LAHPIDTQAVSQTDTTTDFVGNGNEEGLANSELILMQGEKQLYHDLENTYNKHSISVIF